MKLIHIGDTISYRGSFGMAAPSRVKVTGLTLTKEPRDKYGVDVHKVSLDEIRANRGCFDLDNGHWAYSEQVDEAGGEKI